MPKGDRLKLKADPEDGTTPIANLLLEAVAMAKITGLQKGALLYLWRRTYGWVGKDGKRLKEAKISLTEWREVLDYEKSRISSALAGLELKNIIRRWQADVWGGYYYNINTDITKWNSNSINLSKLAESIGIADFSTVATNGTLAPSPNSCLNKDSADNNNNSPTQNRTVAVDSTEQLLKKGQPTLYKENLKKEERKKVDVLLTSPFGKQIGEVFSHLDKLRGYKTTKRKAEAGAIMRMLKNSRYTTNQITETWKKMKSDPFYQKQELFMMTVESHIGAIVHGNKEQAKHQDVKIND